MSTCFVVFSQGRVEPKCQRIVFLTPNVNERDFAQAVLIPNDNESLLRQAVLTPNVNGILFHQGVLTQNVNDKKNIKDLFLPSFVGTKCQRTCFCKALLTQIVNDLFSPNRVYTKCERLFFFCRQAVLTLNVNDILFRQAASTPNVRENLPQGCVDINVHAALPPGCVDTRRQHFLERGR